MTSGTVRKRQPSIHFSWKNHFRTILLLFFLALSLILFNQIKDAQQFPIKKVNVFGVNHLNSLEVQHLLTPLVDKGFFAVNVGMIKERMLQLPWVADASVRRVWPDQVIVILSERNAVACWNNKSLLSLNGELFSPDRNSYPANLPQFIGPEGEQINMLRYYSRINQILAPLHFKMAQLELTPFLSWKVMFDNGMKVNLGHKDVLTRVTHFVKVYPKIVGERAKEVDYVDLRYPNGLAVRWKTV